GIGIEESLDVDVRTPLQCPSLFESTVATLLHGAAPGTRDQWTGHRIRRLSPFPLGPDAPTRPGIGGSRGAISCTETALPLPRNRRSGPPRPAEKRSGGCSRFEEQAARPLEGDRHLPRQQLADRGADHLGPPSLCQAGVRVAPQELL